MLFGTNTAFFAIVIEAIPSALLREGFSGTNTRRTGTEKG